MRRKQNNHRRKRGRFSFLWKPLCAMVAAVAMFLAITFFFRMEHVVITGMSRYSEQEVLDASGLQIGENLYLINKFEVQRVLFERLPYLEEVQINRKLPDTMFLAVHECAADAAVQDGDGYWLLSGSGKLLERVTTPDTRCVLLRGVHLTEPVVAHPANFGEADAYRAGVTMMLLREATQRGMRDKITVIDLSDAAALSMEYLSRFTVRMPWTMDIGYRLDMLATVVNHLEDNETGVIDLMTEGKASFIPG